MTEAAETTVRTLEPAALLAFDLWSGGGEAETRLGEVLGGRLPGLGEATALPGGWRAIRVEPTVWWLSGPLDEVQAVTRRTEASLAADGATTELSGAFTRLEVAGPAWRDLLMIGGLFDAEAQAFGAGRTAGTLLHHVSVRYDVVDADRLHIFVAPSYAGDLQHHLKAALA